MTATIRSALTRLRTGAGQLGVGQAVAGAILAGQAVVVVALAMVTLVGGVRAQVTGERTGDLLALLALLVLFLLGAAGLVVIAAGVLWARRWALAPLLLSQALAVLLAWNLIGDPREGWQAAGAVLGVLALTCAFAGATGVARGDAPPRSRGG